MSKATHRHKTNMLYKFGQYAVKKSVNTYDTPQG